MLEKLIHGSYESCRVDWRCIPSFLNPISQIYRKNFADFPGIFFDVHAPSLRPDRRLGKVAVFPYQPTAEGEDQIRFSPDRQLKSHLPFRYLKTVRMTRRKTEERIPRLHDDWGHGHFSELYQFFGRSGFSDAAARDDQRSLGLGQKSGGILQSFRVSCDARTDARPFRLRILHVNRFAEKVGGKGEINRA